MIQMVRIIQDTRAIDLSSEIKGPSGRRKYIGSQEVKFALVLVLIQALFSIILKELCYLYTR